DLKTLLRAACDDEAACLPGVAIRARAGRSCLARGVARRRRGHRRGGGGRGGRARGLGGELALSGLRDELADRLAEEVAAQGVDDDEDEDPHEGEEAELQHHVGELAHRPPPAAAWARTRKTMRVRPISMTESGSRRACLT